jgi:RNA polymerase-binding transcription factor DksA
MSEQSQFPENVIARYSDEELQEFKALIDDKMGKARNELQYLEEQIQELTESSNDNQSGDWFDDSSLHSDIEMLNNMALRQRQFIDALEAALIRIRNKTYGICTVTGKLIDKKRLQVVPHATKSLEAKEIEKTQVESKLIKPVIAAPVIQTKPKEETKEKKIITKVIKRSGSKTTVSKPADDDDELLFEAPVTDFEDDFDDGGLNDMEVDDEVDVDVDNIPDEREEYEE